MVSLHADLLLCGWGPQEFLANTALTKRDGITGFDISFTWNVAWNLRGVCLKTDQKEKLAQIF